MVIFSSSQIWLQEEYFFSSVINWYLYLYFFVFFMHSRMLYMDDQYLSFVTVGILNTLLDFLIEFELIIEFELTLCGTLVLVSLHLLLYAWLLNLTLYHIFLANLNHLLDSSFSSWFLATHSFFSYFSILYGYEIESVSFKDLEESFFFILSPKNTTFYLCFYHFSKIYFL